MLVAEPILLLVTIYLSIVYGIINASKLMAPRSYLMTTLNMLFLVFEVFPAIFMHITSPFFMMALSSSALALDQ
jgi:hypothetical protein